MAIVTLKCNNCNGDVELDDTRKFGFCIYCGTKIMIQQDINNIYVSMGIKEQVDNLKVLMVGHFQAGRYIESSDFAKKIIDLNCADADVWFIATMCLLRTITFDSLQANISELKYLYGNYCVLSGADPSSLDDEIKRTFSEEYKKIESRELAYAINSSWESFRDNPVQARDELYKLRSMHPDDEGIMVTLICFCLLDTSVPISEIRPLIEDYKLSFDSNPRPIFDQIEGLGCFFFNDSNHLLSLWDKLEDLSFGCLEFDVSTFYVAISRGWDNVIEHFSARIVSKTGVSIKQILSSISERDKQFGFVNVAWKQSPKDIERICAVPNSVVECIFTSGKTKVNLRPNSDVEKFELFYPSIVEIEIRYDGHATIGKYLYCGPRSSEIIDKKSKKINKLFKKQVVESDIDSIGIIIDASTGAVTVGISELSTNVILYPLDD